MILKASLYIILILEPLNFLVCRMGIVTLFFGRSCIFCTKVFCVFYCICIWLKLFIVHFLSSFFFPLPFFLFYSARARLLALGDAPPLLDRYPNIGEPPPNKLAVSINPLKYFTVLTLNSIVESSSQQIAARA